MRDYNVTVCSECKTASCWYGELMCEKSKHCITTTKFAASYLKDINLEDPSNYSVEKLEKVCGSVEYFITDEMVEDIYNRGIKHEIWKDKISLSDFFSLDDKALNHIHQRLLMFEIDSEVQSLLNAKGMNIDHMGMQGYDNERN